MQKMLFSGITRLEPGEPLSTDNFSFQSDNPRLIDRLLEIGARTHRHNAAAPMADPTNVLGLASAAVGGAIPGGTDIYVGYTVMDGDGGESRLSPTDLLSTSAGIQRPETAPTVVMEYTAGTLLVDTYYYAVTWTDSAGGETGMGPRVAVDRDPGFPNARAVISGLTAGIVAAGATGWRLYRATGGGDFGLLATGLAAQDTFTDNGSGAVDCTQLPPADFQNTTGSTNTLQVTLPAAVPAGATLIRLFASLDGSFTEGGLLGAYPVPAELGAVKTFTTLEVVPMRPPSVSTSVGGASKIDPDTELLDWTWKRPVAEFVNLPAAGNTAGDVRLVRLPTPKPYVWDGDSWEPLLAGGHTIEDESVAVALRAKLDFRGTAVAVTDDAANDRTVVTVSGGGAAAPMPFGTKVAWKDTDGVTVASIEARERSFPDQTPVRLSNYATETYAQTGFTNPNMDLVGGYIVPITNDQGQNAYGPGQLGADFDASLGFQVLDAPNTNRLGLLIGGGVGTQGLGAFLMNQNDGTWRFAIANRVDGASRGNGNVYAEAVADIPVLPLNTDLWIGLTRKNGLVTGSIFVAGWANPIIVSRDFSTDPTYASAPQPWALHADWDTASPSWRSISAEIYNQKWPTEMRLAITPPVASGDPEKAVLLSQNGRLRAENTLTSPAIDAVKMGGTPYFSFEGNRVFLDGEITPIDTNEALIASGLPNPYIGPATFRVLDAAGAVQTLTVAANLAGVVELRRTSTGVAPFSLAGLSYNG